MFTPLVSVVIPTYNRDFCIVESVDSVLAQTYDNIEIIIIDDGSTDTTKELLERYKNRIVYIYQENQGVSAARNNGIKVARGEWIAFLDSDDIWMSQKLESQISCVSQKNVIYFHASEWFVDNDEDLDLMHKCKDIFWPRVNSKGFVIDPVLSVAQADPYMTPSILCHKSCFELIGLFDESLTAGEDEDWLSRASMKFDFYFLSEVHVKIRYHHRQTGLWRQESLQSLIKVFEKMNDRFINVHPEAGNIARRRLANAKSHLANIFSRQGKKYDAARYAWSAFLLNKTKYSFALKSLMFLGGYKR